MLYCCVSGACRNSVIYKKRLLGNGSTVTAARDKTFVDEVVF